MLVDLGQDKCISNVRVYPYPPTYINQIVDIEISDDSISWSKIFTDWTIPNAGEWNSQLFTETIGRYIKINFT